MAVDYTTLIAGKDTFGSIKSWANHSVLDAPGILTMAQAWIYERLRAREMRAETTIALAEGASSVAFPTNYLQVIELRWFGEDRALYFVHENLLKRYTDPDTEEVETGVPTRFTEFDEAFQFDVAAQEDLSGSLLYYRTPDPLSPTNTTNFLTRRWPTLVKTACMALAYDDRKRDTDAKDMFLKAESMIDEINGLIDKARNGQVLR
jgi:hypothetical protein